MRSKLIYSVFEKILIGSIVQRNELVVALLRGNTLIIENLLIYYNYSRQKKD